MLVVVVVVAAVAMVMWLDNNVHFCLELACLDLLYMWFFNEVVCLKLE